jgi:hypothetical protein
MTMKIRILKDFRAEKQIPREALLRKLSRAARNDKTWEARYGPAGSRVCAVGWARLESVGFLDGKVLLWN